MTDPNSFFSVLKRFPPHPFKWLAFSLAVLLMVSSVSILYAQAGQVHLSLPKSLQQSVTSHSMESKMLADFSPTEKSTTTTAQPSSVESPRQIATTSSVLTEEEEEKSLTQRLLELSRTSVTLPKSLSPSTFFSIKPNRGFTNLVRGKMVFLAIPVHHGYISSRFGRRNGRPHTGTDFAAPLGSLIYASAPGQVSTSGWSGGYGNLVVVDHGNGVKTRYGHCSKLLVRSGQWVEQGQPIGRVGNTGHSTGPHLHYEVWMDNRPHNPEAFLIR